jgi:hypothetical protein
MYGFGDDDYFCKITRHEVSIALVNYYEGKKENQPSQDAT